MLLSLNTTLSQSEASKSEHIAAENQNSVKHLVNVGICGP